VKTVNTEDLQLIQFTSVTVMIRDLSQQALAMGYLTLEAEKSTAADVNYHEV
jgi:hypothetical protein